MTHQPCNVHKENPVKGYDLCVGCEIERLRSERDAAVQRQDALTSYINRLSAAVEACMSDDERKFVFTPDEYAELESALNSSFSGCLVRRDRLKQAEALDSVAGAVREKGKGVITVAALNYIAAEWREGRKTAVDKDKELT